MKIVVRGRNHLIFFSSQTKGNDEMRFSISVWLTCRYKEFRSDQKYLVYLNILFTYTYIRFSPAVGFGYRLYI